LLEQCSYPFTTLDWLITQGQLVTPASLSDVAIIHARTSYTNAEGEQRNGRYTDVWARRDGQWLAVAAHVTR
jgi:hypothetical protein